MIDLLLHAPGGKADFVTFATSHPPANPLMVQQDNDEGGTTNVIRPGLSFVWWAGSGQFMTDAGDPEADPPVAPTFAPGDVARLRVSSDFFNDRLVPDPEDPDAAEQWARSKVAKYIKDNGVLGSMAGGSIPYYELSGVRILRPTDVETWMAANSLTRHEWFGGNSY